LKKRHKPNKEEKTFLLVELRIAIQKYWKKLVISTASWVGVDSEMEKNKYYEGEKKGYLLDIMKDFICMIPLKQLSQNDKITKMEKRLVVAWG
jgi:predicted transcriptional regulator